MTKLIIQIPCFNEEATLAVTLRALPKRLPGVDVIETLVVDDGSGDGTRAVAREGANYLLRLSPHQGLARAFSAGLDAALKLGADIIVNTDADCQYPGSSVDRLIAPILAGQADMVIGDRAPQWLPHFGVWKRLLQRYGSWFVGQLSNTIVPDATSGFRAFSRRAALNMNVISNYTYTLETIIQAGKKHISVAYVPVDAEAVERPSRLFRHLRQYLGRSAATLLRTYAIYEPLRVFGIAGISLVSLGTIIGLRFLGYYLFTEAHGGHIQSLILSAILIVVGFQTLLLAVIADLIGSNRYLLEETLLRVRKVELNVTSCEIEDLEILRRDEGLRKANERPPLRTHPDVPRAS